MKKLISVIIVNWDKKKLLNDCLKSLFINHKQLEVIVVDNGSKDGSVELLKKNFPKVKIVENSKNLGFAQANNQGFNISKGNFILFLNNDTEVTKGFLNPLIKSLERDKKTGGVQSKILLEDDKKKLDSIGAFFTNTGFLYHFGFRQLDKKNLDESVDLYSAKGACMLFKREVLKKILVDGEIFDSRYFAYFEETDLCHRVWLAGYKIKYIPNSVVYHKVGATSSKLGDPFIQYHSFKNRVDSYIKNLGFFYLIRVLPLHLSLCVIASLSYLLRGNGRVSYAIIKSLGWNFINLAKTLERRRFIQKQIRKVNDESFLPGLTKTVGLDYFIAHLKGLENYKKS